jgi:non-homologous end joining protein Ku
MGTLLRYPYEVRDEKEYFDDIQDVKPRTSHPAISAFPDMAVGSACTLLVF